MEEEVFRVWFEVGERQRARDEDMSMNSLEIDGGAGAGEDDTNEDSSQAACAEVEESPGQGMWTVMTTAVVRKRRTSQRQSGWRKETTKMTAVLAVVWGDSDWHLGPSFFFGLRPRCGRRGMGNHSTDGGTSGGGASEWPYCPLKVVHGSGGCPIFGWTSLQSWEGVGVQSCWDATEVIWGAKGYAPQGSDRPLY